MRGARSRSGTSATSATSTATSSSTRAISRSRCDGCGASRARACRTSSTSTARSRARRATPAGSTSSMQPERRNRVKVLLFLDIGGSMDPHVDAARSCSRRRRASSAISSTSTSTTASTTTCGATTRAAATSACPTLEVLRTYGPDWRLIVVGDAAMSPYELAEPGGSVEYANDEPGLAWLARVFEHFRHRIWWNPEPERTWEYTRSTQMIASVLGAADVSADAGGCRARHRRVAPVVSAASG